jgi:N utilization substance protein A
MEVIVVEDQLSLAIGKRGQNVRLATRLVGWNIDIVSEEVLKKEVAQQMGKLMASGEAVPVSALEGVSASQAEGLKEKGITDVETLANTSVDDLVEILDVSLDEAESILAAAQNVVSAREALNVENDGESEESSEETTSETSENESSEEIASEAEGIQSNGNIEVSAEENSNESRS